MVHALYAISHHMPIYSTNVAASQLLTRVGRPCFHCPPLVRDLQNGSPQTEHLTRPWQGLSHSPFSKSCLTAECLQNLFHIPSLLVLLTPHPRWIRRSKTGLTVILTRWTDCHLYQHGAQDAQVLFTIRPLLQNPVKFWEITSNQFRTFLMSYIGVSNK